MRAPQQISGRARLRTRDRGTRGHAPTGPCRTEPGIRCGLIEHTGGELCIEDAALYQALHRLDRQGLVDAEWRASRNNRRARYYALTQAGRKRLRDETATWRRYSRAVEAVLEGA